MWISSQAFFYKINTFVGRVNLILLTECIIILEFYILKTWPRLLMMWKGFKIQPSSVRGLSFLTGIRSCGNHGHNAGFHGVLKGNMVALFQLLCLKNTGQNASLPVSWAKDISIMDLEERSGQSKWPFQHSYSQKVCTNRFSFSLLVLNISVYGLLLLFMNTQTEN